MNSSTFVFALCLAAGSAFASGAAPQSSTTQIDAPVRSVSLSGIVVDAARRGIRGVLIEECQRDWKQCSRFGRTDKNGRFVSAGRRTGEHLLQFSSEGFETLEIRVILNPYVMHSLEVSLEVEKQAPAR